MTACKAVNGKGKLLFHCVGCDGCFLQTGCLLASGFFHVTSHILSKIRLLGIIGDLSLQYLGLLPYLSGYKTGFLSL